MYGNSTISLQTITNNQGREMVNPILLSKAKENLIGSIFIYLCYKQVFQNIFFTIDELQLCTVNLKWKLYKACPQNLDA